MLCFPQKSLVPVTLPVQLVSFVMSPILLKAYGPALFAFLVRKAAAEDIFPGYLDTLHPKYQPARIEAGTLVQLETAPEL